VDRLKGSWENNYAVQVKHVIGRLKIVVGAELTMRFNVKHYLATVADLLNSFPSKKK